MGLKKYQNYLQELLTTSEAESVLTNMTDPLTKSLTRITTRNHKNHLDKRINNHNRQLTPSSHNILRNKYYIDRTDRSIPLGSSRIHQCGYIYMQEMAASIPAQLVDIIPDGFILDMCAAPWGKSIQVADRLLATYPNQPGLVRSNDVSAKRLIALQSNLNRAGLANHIISKINGESFGKVFPNTFDTILLDAPCSGEGTWYKSSSAYERRHQSGVRKIANIQHSLLISAAKAIKIGGSIIYSTCTLNHRENENQIKRLFEHFPDTFELVDVSQPSLSTALTHYQNDRLLNDDQARCCIRVRPHHHRMGGFFVAKIRKIAPINSRPFSGSFSTDLHHSTSQTRDVSQRLDNHFGINLPTHRTVVSTSKMIFLVSWLALPYLSLAKLEKVGIPILKVIHSRKYNTTDYIPLQHLANTLGHLVTHHIYELTDKQAQSYVAGQSITPNKKLDHGSHYLLTSSWLPVSVAKYTDSILKNKFIGT
jgi:16S rRNA (cytosine1407-C5)-methyltransferase